jgi:hypothetical protein
MRTIVTGIVLAACCAMLAACPSRTGPDDAAPRARLPAKPASDLSTPESALKSYWRTLDWLRQRQRIEDYRNGADSKEVTTGDLMSAVTTGDALTSFAQGPMVDLGLDRSIISVARHGDNKATIVAKIRNLGQGATAFTPTPIELFDTAPGGDFRYLLVRESDGWKVAEVWRTDEPSGPRRLR